TMRSPKSVNNTFAQDETRPLLILFWIEDDLSLTIAIIARAGIGGGDVYRSTELFRAGSKVERVYPLKVGSGVLAHCHHVDGAVRPRGQAYNRRSGDTDFWHG